MQISENFLDDCVIHESLCDIYSICHTALLRGTVPKFSAENQINITLCQQYPPVLEGLTLTEESFIARSHPVGLVVKIQPGSHPSDVSYHTFRGYLIVIPQDPGPLLQIIPSPELQLHNLIKVIWLGNQVPMDAELRLFLVV